MIFVILMEGILAFFAFKLILPSDIKMWKPWIRWESHYAFIAVFITIIYMAYTVSQII